MSSWMHTCLHDDLPVLLSPCFMPHTYTYIACIPSPARTRHPSQLMCISTIWRNRPNSPVAYTSSIVAILITNMHFFFLFSTEAACVWACVSATVLVPPRDVSLRVNCRLLPAVCSIPPFLISSGKQGGSVLARFPADSPPLLGPTRHAQRLLLPCMHFIQATDRLYTSREARKDGRREEI
jgi:hypothetical protein